MAICEASSLWTSCTPRSFAILLGVGWDELSVAGRVSRNKMGEACKSVILGVTGGTFLWRRRDLLEGWICD